MANIYKILELQRQIEHLEKRENYFNKHRSYDTWNQISGILEKLEKIKTERDKLFNKLSNNEKNKFMQTISLDTENSGEVETDDMVDYEEEKGGNNGKSKPDSES